MFKFATVSRLTLTPRRPKPDVAFVAIYTIGTSVRRWGLVECGARAENLMPPVERVGAAA